MADGAADYLRRRKALEEELQYKKDIGIANEKELAQLERISVLNEGLVAKAKRKLKEETLSSEILKKTRATVSKQQGELTSISSVYGKLVASQRASLEIAGKDLTKRIHQFKASKEEAAIMNETLGDVSKLQALQQQMAESGPEQAELQKSIRDEYVAQHQEILDTLKEKRVLGELTAAQYKALLDIVNAENKNFEVAQQYGTVSKETKEIIEGQIEAYQTIEKTIRGTLGTAKLMFGGFKGFLAGSLIGGGMILEKWGASIRSFGGYVDSAQISSFALGTVFKDAEEVTKSLSKEFGGLKDITFATQLNTNLMAVNMGISGEEAANVVGNFARLNGLSAGTAMDMAATTKAMAKAAGVPVDSVMKDVAGSAEAFAEYGKDGGMNIAKAAVSAAKLGVNMSSLTKVTDSLLDFETSINNELELGAMLGRNINLDRARGLAYENNIGGAVKETLQQLGGIEEFNRMDIFQKRKAAELLGLSVEEFQKMAANSDKLNDDGTIQLSKFDTIKETLTGIVTGPLGGFLKGIGGGVIAIGQMGTGLNALGINMGGIVKSSAEYVKNMVKAAASKMFGKSGPAESASQFAGGSFSKGKELLAQRKGLVPTSEAAAATPSKAPAPIKGAAPQTQAGPADKAGAFGKMNTTALLKGAAALLILGAALYVFAKAANAFGDDINWANVFIGIGAMTLLGGVAAILGAVGPMILIGAAALLVASAAFYVFGIASQEVAKGMAMMGEALPLFAAGMTAFADAPYIQFGLGMVGLAASMLVLGAAAPFMMLAGAGLMMVTNALNALAPTIPIIMEQISALSQINFMPIFGLATALTVLSGALAAVAVTGMLALPALLALGLIAGGAAAIMGGGEGEGGGDRTAELIDEIKGLRADLNSGKIAVNMDGQKVTSKISSVVSKVGSNSYAKV